MSHQHKDDALTGKSSTICLSPERCKRIDDRRHASVSRQAWVDAVIDDALTNNTDAKARLAEWLHDHLPHDDEGEPAAMDRFDELAALILEPATRKQG